MPQPHVVIVSRQFWPYMSDATLRIIARAHQLHDIGYRVTVLTQRPNKSWPPAITIGPISVVRLEGSYWNPIRAGRYARRTTQWLTQQASAYQAIVFDEVGIEAVHFLGAARSDCTTILRFDLGAWEGGTLWRPPKATLAAMRRAEGIQVPNQISRRALLAAGIDASRVQFVPELHHHALDRSIGARRDARASLAEISQDLTLAPREKLVVCPGECNERWNVESFAQSCLPFLESHPHVRLWILGEGNGRIRIFDIFRHHGLSRAVSLPGIFSDMDSILQAADLCVFPGEAAGLSALGPTCVHNDVPLLFQQSAYTKEFVAGCEAGFNLLVEDRLEWGTRLSQWDENPEECRNSTMHLRLHQAQNQSPPPFVHGLQEKMLDWTSQTA